MVFCHEWVQVVDGTMCAVRLKEDLSGTLGNPVLLFHATDAPWSVELTGTKRRGYVTDGPWLHRLKSGMLLAMLWSSFGKDGKYKVGVAPQRLGRNSGTLDPRRKAPFRERRRPFHAF